MSTETMLQKLQDDADGGPADRLAKVMLDQLFAARVDSLIPPAELAKGLRLSVDAYLTSPEALKTLETIVEGAVAELKSTAPLRDAVPPALRELLFEMAGRPYSPDRRVVLKVLDRGPMRELIRGLVLDTVTAFGARMAAPAASVTKGLGGLARFAAGAVKQRGGALGGLVGAVSNEVQSQMEKRGADFADAAISSVLNEIADSISDPKRAGEAAQLRVEALKGALELTPQQLGRELINLDVTGGAEVLRAGVKTWLQSPAGTAAFDRLAKGIAVDRTVGQVLDAGGQRASAETIGRALLRSRLKVLFASPEYAEWFRALSA